jgi:hypothetical protein
MPAHHLFFGSLRTGITEDLRQPPTYLAWDADNDPPRPIGVEDGKRRRQTNLLVLLDLLRGSGFFHF